MPKKETVARLVGAALVALAVAPWMGVGTAAAVTPTGADATVKASQVPTTAEQFPEKRTDCPDVDPSIDGDVFHFVLPDHDYRFVELTAVFDTGAITITSFGPPTGMHAYVEAPHGATLINAYADLAPDDANTPDEFVISHVCVGSGTTTTSSAPATTTTSAPATTTTSAPATTTSSAPATTTTSAPATTTSSAPATTTSSAPATTTSSAPATTTSSAPATTTSSAPATTTSSAPATTTSSAPATTTTSAPATTTTSAPATTTSSAPATTTSSAPATTSTSVPASSSPAATTTSSSGVSVLPTKIGTTPPGGGTASSGTAVLGTKFGQLPRTGLGLPFGAALGLSFALLLAGGALIVVPGRVAVERSRRH